MKGSQKISTLKFITLFLSIIFVLNTTISGSNVRLVEKIEFSRESEIPREPWAFCVTEDELFMITDYEAGNIKIYERDRRNSGFLQLIKTIGRKGFTSDGFANPTYCFYNRDEGKFGVMDFVIRKIFVYDRIRSKEFERVKVVDCFDLGYDIHLIGDKLFISGYKADQNKEPYGLYYINKATNQETFLLSSLHKFALQSDDEYKNKYNQDINIKVIGRKGWFDVQGDDIYFVWEGNLEISKININSGKRSPPFGKKTSNYIKPYASAKAREGYIAGNLDILRKEWSRMSYVRNIFTSSKYVLVIYEGPVRQERESNFWLQFYTLDGSFLREVSIPGQPDYVMYFNKDKNILYSLSNRSSNKEYLILEYEIFE
jgi:hypothetical protein